MEDVDQQKVDLLIEEGARYFPTDVEPKKEIKKTCIMSWLFFAVQEKKLTLNEQEFNQVIDRIYEKVNHLLSTLCGFLTVGELRERIQDLPSDMPVLYQRIEDKYFTTGGWTTIPIIWDVVKASEKVIQWEKENPCEENKIVYEDGQAFLRNYSGYVQAFSAYPSQTDEGLRAFVINAHY